MDMLDEVCVELRKHGYEPDSIIERAIFFADHDGNMWSLTVPDLKISADQEDDVRADIKAVVASTVLNIGQPQDGNA